jgi:hypothetical protein
MNSHRIIGLAAAAVLAVLLLGSCATSHSEKTAPRPGAGLTEYLEVVNGSRQAVQSALDSLDALSSQAAAPSPAVVSAFSGEVDQLASKSLTVRARSQAMIARGDAYFENWQQNMASISDRQVRAAAELHRAELQQSFADIKRNLQLVRESFQPFLAGLRHLRQSVEADPAQVSVNATRDLIQAAKSHGAEVNQRFEMVAAELKKMLAMITPATTAAKE